MYYILVGSGSEQPKPLAEGETKSVQTHCTLDKDTLIDAMDIGNNMPGTYAYINSGCVYPIIFSVSFICQGGYGCHGKQSGECGVCCSGHCHWLNDHYPQRYQRHNEDDAADHDATISASSRPCSTIAAPPSPTTFTLFFLPNPIIYYIPLPPNSQTRFHGHVFTKPAWSQLHQHNVWTFSPQQILSQHVLPPEVLPQQVHVCPLPPQPPYRQLTKLYNFTSVMVVVALRGTPSLVLTFYLIIPVCSI